MRLALGFWYPYKRILVLERDLPLHCPGFRGWKNTGILKSDLQKLDGFWYFLQKVQAKWRLLKQKAWNTQWKLDVCWWNFKKHRENQRFSMKITKNLWKSIKSLLWTGRGRSWLVLAALAGLGCSGCFWVLLALAAAHENPWKSMKIDEKPRKVNH